MTEDWGRVRRDKSSDVSLVDRINAVVCHRWTRARLLPDANERRRR
jgi:hypothetical protein